MLPYQAMAMDYAAGYQRQSGPDTLGMSTLSSLGGIGGSPFTHSWLIPNQDFTAAAQQQYKQMHNPHSNPMMHTQQAVDPGVLELRKEKSRDAARSRRGKENYEYYELAKMLPLPGAITSQLDKASIIRLTISYLKLRDFSGHGNPPWQRENTTSKLLKSPSMRQSPAVQLFEQHQGTHILQSLDGFALAVAADGRFLYISETVSIYLGLSQVELTGSSIFDYVHQDDHAEIAEQLGLSLRNTQRDGGNISPSSRLSDDGGEIGETMNPDVSASMTLTAASAFKGYDRAFCIRMKSTLTKRGCHFKSSGYRVTEKGLKSNVVLGKNGKATSSNYSVVLLLCRLRPQHSFSQNKKTDPPLLGMVALAIALPPPTVHEIRLECDMFVTRINFDFRIAHCEPKVSELLDYTAEELTGKSLYNLCHGEDSERLRKAHMDLINKGQVLTYYYRIMNKNGGYTWLQTCATIVCSVKNADEQSIICVNYVVSLRENEHLILDSIQLKGGLDNIKSEILTADPIETTNIDVDCTADRKALSIDIPVTLNDNSSIEKTCDPFVKEVVEIVQKPVEIPTPKKRGRKRKVKDTDDPNINNTSSDLPKIENSSKTKTKNEPAIIEPPRNLPSPSDDPNDQYKPQQEKSSTIQWIGNSNPNAYSTQIPSASTLLSQLYANRESVIRATARQTPTGIYYSTDGTNQNDVTSLPTPPGGNDVSYENQYIQLHAQKTSDTFNNIVSSYGGYHSSIDYQNVPTPPSSVSPRDSTKSVPINAHFEYATDPILRSQYNNNNNNNNNNSNNNQNTNGNDTTTINTTNTPLLPLKPQPYSAAVAAMHHHSDGSIPSYTSLDQTQYFSPHSSFHLYHKSVPTTPAGWYTTPS